MNNIGVGTNATERLWKLRKSNPPVEKQGIMGMAGIGQTTLAEQVYHDSKVVHSFAFHAWAYVSQESKIAYPETFFWEL